jgi:glutamyl-Q tRNA(Asp) synthetase
VAPPRTDYRGRFAPSPTGPLHLGSLIAAVASYLDARHHGGEWLVRMEDLDPPREEAGAADRILAGLRAHGLHWDGHVRYQSTRAAAYEAVLAKLAAAGHLFRCSCTRAALGPDGACRGDCRMCEPSPDTPVSTRVSVPADCTIVFTDGLQGEQHHRLGETFPDFILKRKDGLAAYQLAVVVDDHDQRITHVVRGADLLDSTPRQVFLQRLLTYPTPAYSHLPIITHRDGRKLSKQNFAPALADDAAPDNLRLALRFLGQAPPPAALTRPAQLLDFAAAHWQPGDIPRALAVAAAELGLTL